MHSLPSFNILIAFVPPYIHLTLPTLPPSSESSDRLDTQPEASKQTPQPYARSRQFFFGQPVALPSQNSSNAQVAYYVRGSDNAGGPSCYESLSPSKPDEDSIAEYSHIWRGNCLVRPSRGISDVNEEQQRPRTKLQGSIGDVHSESML